MGSHTIGGTRAVLGQLRVLVRALRLSARESEKKLGVSGAQLLVLQSLADIGAASIGELAKATHTDQSSVSVVVTRLSEAKLVSRRPSREDSRRVDVKLTAAGRALLGRAPETPQQRMVRALEAMPKKRRDDLAASLAHLAREAGLDRSEDVLRGGRSVGTAPSITLRTMFGRGATRSRI